MSNLFEEHDPNETVDDTLLNKSDIPKWLDGKEREVFSVLLAWVNFSEKQSNNRLVGKVFWDDEDDDIKCFLEDLKSDKTIHIEYYPKSQKFAVQLIDHYNDSTDNTQSKTIKRKISTMENINMTLKEFKEKLLENNDSIVVETTTLGKLRENLITEEKKEKPLPTFIEMDDMREKIRKGLTALEVAVRRHMPTCDLASEINKVYKKFMDLPSFETYVQQHKRQLSEKQKTKEERMKKMAREVKTAGEQTVAEADETMAVKIGRNADDKTIEKATKQALKLKTDVVFESRNSLMNSLLTESEKKKLLNEQINQRDYIFYIYSTEQSKILSGWEYKEDAMDRLREMREEGWNNVKIFSKSHLINKLKLNPDDDSNWGREIIEEAKNVKTIRINLTDNGLMMFKKMPPFNRWLYPNQMTALKVGNQNVFNVNHTAYSKLKEAEEWYGNGEITISDITSKLNEQQNLGDDIILLKVFPNGRVKISYPDLEISTPLINLDKALNRVNILMNQRREEFPIYVEEGGRRRKVERNYGREILDEYDDEGFETGVYNNNDEIQGLYGIGIRPFSKINWHEVYGTIEYNNNIFEEKEKGIMLNTGDFMDEMLLSDAEIKHLVDMKLIWLDKDAYPVFYESGDDRPTIYEFIELAKEFWDTEPKNKVKNEPREPRSWDVEPGD